MKFLKKSTTVLMPVTFTVNEGLSAVTPKKVNPLDKWKVILASVLEQQLDDMRTDLIQHKDNVVEIDDQPTHAIIKYLVKDGEIKTYSGKRSIDTEKTIEKLRSYPNPSVSSFTTPQILIMIQALPFVDTYIGPDTSMEIIGGTTLDDLQNVLFNAYLNKFEEPDTKELVSDTTAK